VSVDDRVPEIPDSIPEAWGFDNPKSRERYSRPKVEPTEPLTFRATARNLRILDEIIQSGVDPRLKTKSDCMQDGLSLFIEDWMTNYQDGVSGRTLRMFQMERMAIQSRSRQDYLAEHDSSETRLRNDGDKTGLQTLFMNLQAERQEAVGFTPQSYIDELDKRIAKMEDLF
jgi:hypothetical protein